ncbi:uncharacterized protein Z520_10452 [Fonsecaea multimorphosa CBS 102226]|uniref:Anaphase-promoting complex subunit 11 RING-H2 finger domain-containing protein n=1 Tax=Fonsecaea multimorphosa CBS 102226 TaxID=1442371 RepID=A0A0D2JKN9_9EURO|nr:uncharacterized protein Z520_10452 [Fonsecaea multimorphosa CBS 102226]KIX93827.1 hypothetical protein Z520_10452 [Fonsecaea multimorphosa CBS 102226]OAL19067.1 hypothetical protein AYO22_10015 [Fonsecaea multimorphosa]
MSQQLRQVPTHPSSPSNPTSRRTTSGGGVPVSQTQPQPSTTSPKTRSLLPSPQFEDDPIVASHQQAKLAHSNRPSLTLNNPEYSEHAVAESEHYSHGGGLASAHHPGEVPPTIPSFQPFFTLIEDSVTNEHYHPTVHYIFADDDTDIITEAALRSLEELDPTQRGDNRGGAPPGGRHGRPLSHAAQDQDLHRQDDGINAPRLPPPTADMREHYIILDVHPQPRSTTQNQDDNATPAGAASSVGGGGATVSGGGITGYNYEVTSAHSLSAEWQVLRTSISAAPTIGDGGPSEEGEEGLMLRIEGRGNTPGDLALAMAKEKATGAGAGDAEREKESMEEMIDRFQRRLDDIRMVIEAGVGGISAPVGAAALGGDE